MSAVDAVSAAERELRKTWPEEGRLGLIIERTPTGYVLILDTYLQGPTKRDDYLLSSALPLPLKESEIAGVAKYMVRFHETMYELRFLKEQP